MKKFLYTIGFSAVLLMIGVFAQSKNTDRFTITGTEATWAKDIVRVDNTGNILVGADATTPSSTYYSGLVVNYINTSGNTIAQGAVLISSSATGGCGVTNVTSTTSVVGVNYASCASGANCYMTVSGYALVLSTGSVAYGNVMVSSATASGSGFAGANAAPTTGTDIGVAMQSTTAQGLILIRMR